MRNILVAALLALGCDEGTELRWMPDVKPEDWRVCVVAAAASRPIDTDTNRNRCLEGLGYSRRWVKVAP